MRNVANYVGFKMWWLIGNRRCCGSLEALGFGSDILTVENFEERQGGGGINCDIVKSQCTEIEKIVKCHLIHKINNNFCFPIISVFNE